MNPPRSESLFTIRSEDIDHYWPLIEPHLKRFEAETLLASAETIRANCKAKKQQLWGYHDGQKVIGVMVTELYETARGKVCWIWALCGTQNSPDQIERGFIEVETWARSLGCIALEIRGRRGWERKLPGFKRTAVILEKELSHGIL